MSSKNVDRFRTVLSNHIQTGKKHYSPEFVAKMERNKKQVEEGKVVSYTITQLEQLYK